MSINPAIFELHSQIKAGLSPKPDFIYLPTGSAGTTAGITLGEPLPAALTKAHGQYRFQLMLLGNSARGLSRHINKILAQTPPPEDVTIVFDMDAMGF